MTYQACIFELPPSFSTKFSQQLAKYCNELVSNNNTTCRFFYDNSVTLRFRWTIEYIMRTFSSLSFNTFLVLKLWLSLFSTQTTRANYHFMRLPLLEHYCEHSCEEGGSQRSNNLGCLSTIAGVTGALTILDILLVSEMQNIVLAPDFGRYFSKQSKFP